VSKNNRLNGLNDSNGSNRTCLLTLDTSNLVAATPYYVAYLLYKRKTLTIKSVFYRLYHLYHKDICRYVFIDL